jgi:wobble nucleotide-excising tRNase
MRLNRISKIQEHRVFRDFNWPNTLHTFGQFNLVYGWNGCGKTTLSSLLGLAQKGVALDDGQVELEFDDGSKMSGADFGSKRLPQLRVFNRDFVNDTLRSVGEIAPIYFIGEESTEKQARLEALKRELVTVTDRRSKLEESKDEASTKLDALAKEQAKLIKTALISSTWQAYSNYDKRSFTKTIQRMTNESAKEALLSEELANALRNQKDERVKPKIEPLSAVNADFRNLADRVTQLIGRSVVASTIDQLVEDSELADWVEQGLELHSRRHQSQRCKFCDQAFTKDRRETLETHFNDALSQYQEELTELLREIEGNQASIQEPPPLSDFYVMLSSEAKAAAAALSSAQSEATKLLRDFTKRVDRRLKSPFGKAVTVAAEPRTLPQLAVAIRELNAVIKKHNRLSESFSEAITDAYKKLEAHYVAEVYEEYTDLSGRLSRVQAELEQVVDKPLQIQAEIDDVEAAIRGHRRPASELTKELSDYLGREELQFEVAEAGYRLTRGGKTVTHLSEGERTAIAFLYFLKSLKDQKFNLEDGIVVIDDPVSSLDANALFSAFGYMKERTKGAGQLFIFTHSFPFFRNVKNWFHHLPHQKKRNPDERPGRFFHLRAVQDKAGARSSLLGPLDPLLERYESEYQYLFRCVYEAAHRSSEGSLAAHYGLPNIARRLLEAFLAFRYPDHTGDLRARLELVTFDAPKKTGILRLLHTYSHADSIPESEHDLSVLAETQTVLRDLLELMRAVDAEHYNGLVRLVAASREDEP